nr:signal peptidase II [Phreatobacter sp.]
MPRPTPDDYGGFANLADRLHDGVVTDFIDLHAGGLHFPTFNLADVVITLGAALLLWTALRERQTVQGS